MSNEKERPQYAYSEIAKAYDDACARKPEDVPYYQYVETRTGKIVEVYIKDPTDKVAIADIERVRQSIEPFALAIGQAFFLVSSAKPGNIQERIGVGFEALQDSRSGCNECTERAMAIVYKLVNYGHVLESIYEKFIPEDGHKLSEKEIKEMDAKLKMLSEYKIYRHFNIESVRSNILQINEIQQTIPEVFDISPLVDRLGERNLTVYDKVDVLAMGFVGGFLTEENTFKLAECFGIPVEDVKKRIAKAMTVKVQ